MHVCVHTYYDISHTHSTVGLSLIYMLKILPIIPSGTKILTHYSFVFYSHIIGQLEIVEIETENGKLKTEIENLKFLFHPLAITPISIQISIHCYLSCLNISLP